MFVFVVMPFKILKVYEEIIKPTLEAEGCTVERGDTHVTQQNIVRRILEQIQKADLVIADITGKNPNVFYELALAHAFLKPTFVITTDNLDRIPFDLKSYDTYRYSLDFDKVDEFKNRLRQHVKTFSEGKLTAANPVTDFLPEYKAKVSEENDNDERYKGTLETIVDLAQTALSVSGYNDWFLHDLLGTVALALEDQMSIIIYGRAMVHKFPSDYRGYYYLAKGYTLDNDWVNLRRVMEIAIKQVKLNKENAIFNLGVAQEQLGQPDLALKSYMTALDLAKEVGNYPLRDIVQSEISRLGNILGMNDT